MVLLTGSLSNSRTFNILRQEAFMHRFGLVTVSLLIATLMVSAPAFADSPETLAALSKDQPGARDNPLTGRYKGAALILQTHKAFDELTLPSAAAIGEEYDATRHFGQTVTAQGEVTRSIYVTPPGRSTLEVVKNYRDTLIAKGFAPVFECAAAACGPSFRKQTYAWDNKATQVEGTDLDHARLGLVEAVFDSSKDIRYSLLKKDETYVGLFGALNAGGGFGDISAALNDRVSVLVEVIEPKAMEQNIVVLDSSALGESLEADGAVNLYGLYFDTDKATLLQSSTPQLSEIAKYLTANPEAQVFVVGHTDMQGGFDHNVTLAAARAKAIAAALTQTYGISAARLTAKGVGPLAPAASNQSEAGRAKNRRVQLVLR